MKTIGIILLILVVVVAGIFVATKFFKKFKDEDNDGIPDAVENAVEDGKEIIQDVKERAKRVKEELGDVKDAAKELVNQAGDVVDAAKKKPRRGRKPKQTKLYESYFNRRSFSCSSIFYCKET